MADVVEVFIIPDKTRVMSKLREEVINRELHAATAFMYADLLPEGDSLWATIPEPVPGPAIVEAVMEHRRIQAASAAAAADSAQTRGLVCLVCHWFGRALELSSIILRNAEGQLWLIVTFAVIGFVLQLPYTTGNGLEAEKKCSDGWKRHCQQPEEKKAQDPKVALLSKSSMSSGTSANHATPNIVID